MFKKKKEYDLVFSIGEACSCSSSLRASYLQEESYPLDWVFGTDFIGRCKIVAGEFKDYINKEDLEYSFSNRSISCSAYHNKTNDLTFNHDFLESVPFDEMYDKVKEKYERRIKRLVDKLKSSKRILIVYMETPITDHEIIPNENIIEGAKIIEEKFKREDNIIDFLYITHKKGVNNKINIKDNILKIEYDYKAYNSDIDYCVNFKRMNKLLSSLYKLKMPRFYFAKRKSIKFIINIAPTKTLRRKLRKRYHF